MSTWMKLDTLRTEARILKDIIRLLEAESKDRVLLRLRSIHANTLNAISKIENSEVEE